MDFELYLTFNFFRLFPSFFVLAAFGFDRQIGQLCSNESFTLVGIMKICTGVLKTVLILDVPLGSRKGLLEE